MKSPVWRAVALTVAMLVLFSWGPKLLSLGGDPGGLTATAGRFQALADRKGLLVLVVSLGLFSFVLAVRGAIARTRRRDGPRRTAFLRDRSKTGPSVARRLGLAQDAVRFLSRPERSGRDVPMQAEGLAVLAGRLFRPRAARVKSAVPQVVNPRGVGSARGQTDRRGTALAEIAAGVPEE